MRGREHLHEANLILAGDNDPCSYGCPHSGCPHEMSMLIRAIGHALVALAAATADLSGYRAEQSKEAVRRASLTCTTEHPSHPQATCPSASSSSPPSPKQPSTGAPTSRSATTATAPPAPPTGMTLTLPASTRTPTTASPSAPATGPHSPSPRQEH